MSYQVLARKWRPKQFAEVVGQQHVLTSLSHALQEGRLHHAYLFTGTRGVGKTTIARVIAKALSCEKGASAAPCGECAACQAIDAGRYVDLIEIDAASRTKVEDTRELLDNVQYAPSQGPYKIYLIDEVHMLSTHSFNALLKTLEEPPEHVKFLLATTDPQKLPITVLSRCLQYHLRHLLPQEISEHLANVLTAEKVSFESEALMLLARAAHGSVRDSLSLLDQAIAFGRGAVKVTTVNEMLGTLDAEQSAAIVLAIANQDKSALVALIEQLRQFGLDYGKVLEAVATLLYQTALMQTLPEALPQDVAQDTLKQLTALLSPVQVQVLYQVAVQCQRDLPLAPDPAIGIEMALLRLFAFQPLQVPAAVNTTALQQTAAKVAAAPAIKALATSQPTVKPGATWDEICSKLQLGGLAKQVVQHCTLAKQADNQFHLCTESHYLAMVNDKMIAVISQALSAVTGKNCTVVIDTGHHKNETPAQVAGKTRAKKQGVAEQAIQDDANIQYMQANFGATIEPNSIKPKETN